MSHRNNIHLFLDRNRFVPDTIKDLHGNGIKTEFIDAFARLQIKRKLQRKF